MLYTCPCCGYAKMRPSKIRFSDLPYLVCLMRPMRCRSCYERFFLFLLKARAIRAQNAATRSEGGSVEQQPHS